MGRARYTVYRTLPVLDEAAAADPIVAEAYQSIKDYLAKAQIWDDLQHLPRTN